MQQESQHVSGAENGAERAENWVSGERVCEKTMERERSGGARERERRGERTKLAAQIWLKGDMLTENALQPLFNPCQK